MFSKADSLRGDSGALHKRGQELYLRGYFTIAIEAFTKALRKDNADTVGILDNRAATYTKLAKYDLALRDSRQIMKIDKRDERVLLPRNGMIGKAAKIDQGYLRCAKALILDGKPEKALEVYAYGINVLARENPQRQLMKQLHNKLHAMLFAKRQDPLSALPLEIVEMILQCFSFKEIVLLCRTSRNWKQCLISIRRLWMCMDLSGARRKVQWRSIRSYIERSNGMLTHAIVKNVSSTATLRTLKVLSRCLHLEHLEVWDTCDDTVFYELFKTSSKLKAIVTSADVPISQELISKLFVALPLLERAEFHGAAPGLSYNVQWPLELPNLRRLALSTLTPPWHTDQVSGLYVPATLMPNYSIPNLEELRLHLDTLLPQPRHLPFTLSASMSCLRRLDIQELAVDARGFPPSLEYLRIIGQSRRSTRSPFPEDMIMEAPNLHTLIIGNVNWFDVRTLRLFVEVGRAPLRVLHIDFCMKMMGGEILMLKGKGHFDMLTELRLQMTKNVDDSLLADLVDGMVNLKVLDLSYTHITGCTIKMLADFRSRGDAGKPMIERLYVRNCDETSSDALDYGRARGVEIFT